MTKYRHEIRLHGPKAEGPRVSALLLRELLEILVDGCRGAVRLRVEGKSFARGTQPSWLAVASDFELVGLREGSTVLDLEAPPLADAMPEQFAQLSMAGADGRRSGLSFFGESLARALEGEEDTELFDAGLLERISKLEKVFGSGIDSFELCTEEPRGVKKVEVAPNRIESVDLLIRKTPPQQQVRVAGTLNMIRHSDKMFSLTLENGEALKGVAECASAEHLATLFGQPVMVSGEAVFRPSGSLLRIEATHLRPATDDEGFWSVVPRPGLGTLEPVATRKEQGPRSGINAIWGKWPGEESEEQIEEALAAIS